MEQLINMSYVLDTYGPFILFITAIPVLFILLAVYCLIAGYASKRLKSGTKISSFLIGCAVFGAGISLYFLLLYVPDYLNDGQLKTIYIVEKNKKEHLVAWFVRVDHPAGMSTAYSHRIKSFDLETGKQRGRLTLSRRYRFNDYHIYGPFHQFAWGYGAREGMMFLDVFDAIVVADEKDILKRNPVLGDAVRLVRDTGPRRFDPVTYGLYVYTAKGDTYRINPDLNATRTRDIDRKSEIHVKETCAVCRQADQFIRIKEARTGWTLDPLNSRKLLFLSPHGKVLNTLMIADKFDDNAYLYAAAQVNDEIWLFITVKRYHLSAIKTDSKTGKILGRIDFF